MVDSQPMEEEIQGAKARNVGTETHGGPTEPVLQTQKTPSPSPTFIKEHIDVLRTMIKEHDQQAKTKASPRRLAYADSNKETSARHFDVIYYLGHMFRPLDFLYVIHVDLIIGSRCLIPAFHLVLLGRYRSRKLEDRSRTKEKQEGKGPSLEGKGLGIKKQTRNLNTRKGKAPSEHQGILGKQRFGGSFKYLLACGRAGRMVDACLFEELSQKFLEEFSQQKRYAKDRTEIHGIKRRQNKGLQTFMDRFKFKSSHIKGVSPILRISAFMHGHGHPELANKLNDKIPKLMDAMLERWDKGNVHPAWSGGPEKAKNRGGSRETRRNMGIYTPYPRKDTFTLLIKTLKEILAMESRQRPQHQRLLSVKKADRRSYGLRDVGPSGKGYPLEQPEERESRKEQRKSHKHDKWMRKSQETF
ncbi:hypothetical protein Tco_1355067 [Tanacetum coccineum]